jgi:signal transduction histidine kinase/ligand-binding sensor domain-containing protein/CheY-like chemotaxis protein
LITFTKKDGLSDNIIRAILEDRQGSLWIGTWGGGLNRLKKDTFTIYSTKNGLSNNRIRCLYEDIHGNLWVGTHGGGLNRLSEEDGKFTVLSKEQGLPGNIVTSISEDQEGSLWIGVWGGGLNRLQDGKFTTYTTREGLINNEVISIFEDRSGHLWFATDGGLSQLDPGRRVFTNYSQTQGISSNLVVSIYEDRKGNLWLGTDGGGLNRLKNGTFTSYTTRSGLSYDMIRAIREDRQGNLWIGTWGGGLNRLKDGKFSVFTTKNGLSDDTIRVIHEDRQGNLWLGTDNGLNRLVEPGPGNSEYSFKVYNTTNGLSNNMVRTIHEDGEGYLWLGTRGGGLNRFKGEKFTPVTSNNGLFDDTVFDILEDDLGNFWMSCNKGIFRVSRKQLMDFCDDKIAGVNCIHYNEKDGMKSRECNGISQPSSWKSRDGKLWFPTKKGVVVIDPRDIKINPLPPPVTIRQVIADSNKVRPPFTGSGEIPEFPASLERLEIHYTGLSLLSPGNVRFKYKLEGLEKEWVDVGDRRTAYYTSLSPGYYTFRVIAANNDGVWNEIGTSFSFYKRPYFYQTWWFFILTAMFVLLTAAAAYILRVRGLKHRKIELERLVAERTRQLEEKSASLERAVRIARSEREAANAANQARGEFLARMSHEIRTPMNGILGFADMLRQTALDKQQKDYVETISSSGEALTTLLNDILDFSRIEAGRLVMRLQDFSPAQTVVEVVDILRPRIAGKPVEMKYVIDPRLPELLKGDGGRFRQVLVNLLGNAVKFTESGEILLELKMEEQEKRRIKLHVTIRDTGVGIPEDQLETIFDVFQQVDGSHTREHGGVGLGLSISRQIAELMDGNVWAESTPGKGSTFHFTAWMEQPETSTGTVRAASAEQVETGNHRPVDNPLHILVAEDNPINQKLVRFMLMQTGYRVSLAANGEEAVESYMSQPGAFDLIFMDVQMPRLNGMDAARRIREMELAQQDKKKPAGIPIIAMTKTRRYSHYRHDRPEYER